MTPDDLDVPRMTPNLEYWTHGSVRSGVINRIGGKSGKSTLASGNSNGNSNGESAGNNTGSSSSSGYGPLCFRAASAYMAKCKEHP